MKKSFNQIFFFSAWTQTALKTQLGVKETANWERKSNENPKTPQSGPGDKGKNERKARQKTSGVARGRWTCSDGDDDDKCGVPERSSTRLHLSPRRDASQSAQPCKYNEPVRVRSARSITAKQKLHR